MNKVTDFLERHVQWLTLALALAYVGYMGYSYIYLPPLSVEVGRPPTLEAATPGTVDQKILDGPVSLLERAIKDPKVEPPKVADVLKSFDEKIGEKNVGRTDLATAWDAPHRGLIEGSESGPQQNNIVNSFPSAPPAIPAQAGPIAAQWTVAMMPGQSGGSTRTDVAYFMGSFTIDMAALAQEINQAFSKEKVPANLLNSEFVRVDLYREERQANGQWGAPRIVPPLSINVMQPYPGDLGKKPSNPADQQAWFNYENWAQKNQQLFTQPPFYTTATDVPKPAAGAADLPAAQLQPLAPAAAVPSPALINPIGGGVNPDAGGAINAALMQGNLQLTLHDASLEEGKTYRYAVRYRLFNPFYTKLALATKEVASKFDYASPDPTDPKTPNVAQLWTGPVTPEPRGYIFVQHINQYKNEAQFSVWTWKDGRWHESNANKLNPGDPVSALKGASRWTLVDVRRDPRSNDVYVIVMDEQGALQQRDEKTDAADPMLIKLKAQGAPGSSPAAQAR